MSCSEKPILVFDSGVGGLSVVAHLRQQMPGRLLAYCCDNQALPYGTKPDAWLIDRIVRICRDAVEAVQASVLVVACNTASTLALTPLRDALSIPVVGTVPAIKPAVRISRSKVIGLLATSATTQRIYTDQLIARFARGARVVKIAADPLVTAAEQIAAGKPADMDTIASAIQPVLNKPALDTVVLGCTHFPLLKEHLAALAPAHIDWIDSGAAIARRTQAVAPPLASPQDASADEPNPSLATAATAPGLASMLARFGFAAPIPLDVSLLSH